MKHPNDNRRGNIVRATILSQQYYRLGENGYTIKCRIVYYNPFIRSNQVAVGVAKCNIDDAMSIRHGKHIAESRAKVQMFKTLQQSIVDVLSETQDKYYNLEVKELNHINELIQERCDTE